MPTNLGALVNGYAPFASFFYNTEGLPYFSVGMGNFGTQIAKSAGWLGGAAPAAAAAVPKGIGGLGAAAGGAGGQVAAGLGHGAHVAGLSVPNSWPGATLASAAKPMSAIPVSEPITSGESGAGNLVGGMPVGGTRCCARGRCRPALRIQTHRHGPPHARGLTPHHTHLEGAPTAHPAAGAPSSISEQTGSAGPPVALRPLRGPFAAAGFLWCSPLQRRPAAAH